MAAGISAFGSSCRMNLSFGFCYTLTRFCAVPHIFGKNHQDSLGGARGIGLTMCDGCGTCSSMAFDIFGGSYARTPVVCPRSLPFLNFPCSWPGPVLEAGHACRPIRH